MAPGQREKAAEHENRRQPEWNVRVHGIGLLRSGFPVLAIRKLSQDEHERDDGDAGHDDDDEFGCHDSSFSCSEKSAAERVENARDHQHEPLPHNSHLLFLISFQR